MCGIGGYVVFDGGGPQRRILTAMAHALRRRGPDAQGVVIETHCGLAHTRLSIIDIAGSPQPMRVEGSDISLVYNGELYNYLTLRDGLARQGQQFATNGDTEVILRSVGKDWDSALAGFDGMFAFGAWDRRAEKLLLARDAIGEKPLFYAMPHPGLIVFGSEIEALLAHPDVTGDLNTAALRQVLRFRAVYGDESLYAGIRQVDPGTFLEFSRQGVRRGRFHDLVDEMTREIEAQRGQSDENLIARGNELMIESVSERLMADAPVGAFLSGGLDSSLIVAHMQRIRGAGSRVQTFSVGFEADQHSELPFAKLVAQAIGTDHTEVSVTQKQYIERISELTYCRGAPLSEPADVAIAEMSRVARESVKVVLSGEGADEAFAGYPKFGFARVPWLVRAGLGLAGPQHIAKLAALLRIDPRRTLVASRALSQKTELDRLVQWFSYLDRDILAQLLPDLGWSQEQWAETTDNQSETLERCEHLSPLARMQMVDCLTWLPGNLLQRGDRMTMAQGLELRPPFLDKRLVAFGLALPDRLKVRRGKGKYVVREWARPILPAEILKRRKWGFRVPLSEWFRGSMKSMLHDYLTASGGLCQTYGNLGMVQKMLDQHDRAAMDLNLPLWTLLTAEIWYQDVFKKSRWKPTELTSIAG